MRGFAIGLVLAGLASPARAECLGQGCLDGLLAFLIGVVVYGILALTLLVMVLRRKWRRAGLRALAVVLVLAIGVPLVSQAWQSWLLWSMERREVAGQPPALTGQVPLMIADKERCSSDACAAVLRGRDEAGILALPLKALDGLDLSQPLNLADLPLEHWTRPDLAGHRVKTRWLSAEERRQTAETINYLILAGRPFYLSEPGPVEVALRGNPALRRMGQGELVKFAMARLEPGVLGLGELEFDLLELWLVTPALGVPLAWGNWQSARNDFASVEVAAAVICPDLNGGVAWECRNLLLD